MRRQPIIIVPLFIGGLALILMFSPIVKNVHIGGWGLLIAVGLAGLIAITGGIAARRRRRRYYRYRPDRRY